ncbi:MAG: hypothetical protein KDD94_03520 [Calditrichaeota bacterium]|nr:hypothetical protein [Calditrichota bacterium]
MGVLAFVGQMMMGPEQLNELPEAQRMIIENTPVWATIAFAVAVFGGFIGSIFLMMKKSLAFELFAASMLGILVQMFHSFFLANSIEVYGPGGMIMPVLVLLIGVYLVWLANTGKTAGWLK